MTFAFRCLRSSAQFSNESRNITRNGNQRAEHCRKKRVFEISNPTDRRKPLRASLGGEKDSGSAEWASSWLTLDNLNNINRVQVVFKQ